MNYGELKQELVNFGFSDMDELDEFGEIVPYAINRAITEINLNVCPIIGTYEFTHDGTEETLLYYDIEELTKEDDTVKFLEFADTPVMVGTTYFKKFNNFEIENEKVLVIDGSIEGNFKVYYKKAHTPFTIDSDDEEELELPLKAHYLVPLLTAYYVWIEDEKALAVDYYNQYERLAAELTANRSKVKGFITSGGI